MKHWGKGKTAQEGGKFLSKIKIFQKGSGPGTLESSSTRTQNLILPVKLRIDPQYETKQGLKHD